MSKCLRCQALNVYGSLTCWACGVRLRGHGQLRPRSPFGLEALRHFRASSAALSHHHAWVDGLVLISTLLFALLLVSFLLGVLPAGEVASPREAVQLTVFNARQALGFRSVAPRAGPVAPAGQPQEVQGVVAQVVDVQRSPSLSGRPAPGGAEFLAVTAVVDNQGTAALSYSLYDWQIRDSRGRTRPAENVRGAGWLSGGTVEPGQKVQGALVFLVPQGDAGGQISFSPPALRVALRWAAAVPAD